MRKIILDFFTTHDRRKSSFVITRAHRSSGHGTTCVSHGIYVETTTKWCKKLTEIQFYYPGTKISVNRTINTSRDNRWRTRRRPWRNGNPNLQHRIRNNSMRKRIHLGSSICRFYHRHLTRNKLVSSSLPRRSSWQSRRRVVNIPTLPYRYMLHSKSSDSKIYKKKSCS
jgi:hypothetical protein